MMMYVAIHPMTDPRITIHCTACSINQPAPDYRTALNHVRLHNHRRHGRGPT